MRTNPCFRALLLSFLLFGCGATAPRQPTAPTQTIQEPTASAPSPLAQTEIPATAGDSDENSIYFGTGATEVDLSGQQKLREHALRLLKNPEMVVTLIGHTDNLGSRSYNLAIAERRIVAVRSLLRAHGAAKHQIRGYALGNEKSDRICKAAKCRQNMRRVELSYPQ